VSEALGTLEETRIEAWEPHSMASPFFSQAFQRFLRADLLREAGKPGEAIEWYRHLGHLVGTSPFELCLLPLALYGQAQAYETLGDLDRAAEHYAGFIELWAHADEEYQPRVQAAQQRLEGAAPPAGPPPLASALDLSLARLEARTIQITAHLQHPNILPLYDSGIAGDML
jgi:tetratricopeptide (TPR) repeat protein